MIEGLLPVMDGHGPLPGRLADRHEHELQGGLLMGINLAIGDRH